MIRLDRFLSDSGLGTRKHCKKAIRSGVVFIDGKKVTDEGLNFDPKKQQVQVNGRPISYVEEIYLLLNKPENYMCSTIDEMYPSVLNLIDETYRKRTKIVGRLDADTTGVLLLTSNGKLNNRLIHPNLGIEKEYEAQLNHPFGAADAEKIMASPIKLDEETTVQPVSVVSCGQESARIIVKEGKYHEIKRIFHRFGYEVIHLERIRLGFLTCQGLEKGKCRFLTPEEIGKLKEITGMI
jgi:16S rRNA pseudouridine516 synthase